MQTYTARQLLSDGESARVINLLTRLTEVAEETQAELRDQILGLNVRLPAGSKTAGVARVLRAYAEALGRRGPIPVDFTAEPEVLDVEIDADAEAQVIRIVQEAITNVTKHADAQRALVSLVLNGDYICAIIEDDGKGFTPHTDPDRKTWHFGLRIMAERAEEIGGDLQIVTVPGQGTKVILNVPCRRPQYSMAPATLAHEATIV
jgi:two-component system sensor histidine kinase DegS